MRKLFVIYDPEFRKINSQYRSFDVDETGIGWCGWPGITKANVANKFTMVRKTT
jgi:hypothetical protein